jgi:ATP-dependent protease ClpP protease subunit
VKKVAHFYCYGIIGERDPLFKVFTGEDDPVISSAKIVDFLNGLSTDIEEVVVHINSRGGNYTEGFAIYNLLTGSGKKITTIGEGQVASIATVVYLAGTKRRIYNTVQPLIHNPWVDPSTLGSSATADDLQAIADEMKLAETKLLDFYVEKTGADKATLEALMKEDVPFSADQALELKFATEIIEPVKAMAYVSINKSSNHNDIMSEVKKVTSKLENKINDILDFMSGKKKTIKAEADAQAADYNTDDGKTISVDGDLAVGSAVTVDGQPTPDATYTLDDGTVIKTDADSNISEVTPPTEASAETDKEKELQAEIVALKEENKTLKDAQAKIETKLNAIAKNIQSNYVVKTGQTNMRTEKSDEKPSTKEEKRKAVLDRKAQYNSKKNNSDSK